MDETKKKQVPTVPDDDEPTVKEYPRQHRTRKAEIVSGISLFITIPMLAFMWSMYKDVRSFKREDDAVIAKQFTDLKTEFRSYCDSLVTTEASQRKETDDKMLGDFRVMQTQQATIIQNQIEEARRGRR